MAPLTWLVTGCSSGFGEQFVHSILARGDRVIATGRSASSRLSHLKSTSAAILDLDVSIPESEITAKVEDALKIYGGIDILVNNAGYFELGFVEDFTYERWLKQFQINFFGAVSLTNAILPHMREKRAGMIVNVGSMFGWDSFAGCPAYDASKFALEGFTESLQKELAPFSVRAIIFEPGFSRTKIIANHTASFTGLPDYQEMAQQAQAGTQAMEGHQPGDVKKVVETMIDVVKGEGVAKGKDMPKRLPLGTDALELVREKCVETLKTMDEWEGIIKGTDVDVKS